VKSRAAHPPYTHSPATVREGERKGGRKGERVKRRER